MPARPRHLALVLAATVLASLTSVAGLAGPAHADRASDAPVTADDTITIRSTSYGEQLDVLANDRDPGGDELAICRVELPDDAPVDVLRVPADFGGELPIPLRGTARAESAGSEILLISARTRSSRTFSFTYYACDLDYLTPATVTVTIKATPRVKATKVAGKPGKVRFTNPGDRRVRVLYGSVREERPDGRFSLAPGESRAVRVHRHQIIFIAIVPRTGELVNFGRVRNIRLPGEKADFGGADAGRRDLKVWRTARLRS